MSVTKTRFGYRATHRKIQEYFPISKFGSDDAAHAAADKWFAGMSAYHPKPKIGKPYICDTWTQTGADQRRVPCLEVLYRKDDQPRNKKFIYENPDEKVEAQRYADVFLAARLKEWEEQ